MRKLVTDGFVEKMGESPVLYSITEKGKERLKQMKYMLSGGLGARYESFIEENRTELEKSICVNADCFDFDLDTDQSGAVPAWRG